MAGPNVDIVPRQAQPSTPAIVWPTECGHKTTGQEIHFQSKAIRAAKKERTEGEMLRSEEAKKQINCLPKHVEDGRRWLKMEREYHHHLPPGHQRGYLDRREELGV